MGEPPTEQDDPPRFDVGSVPPIPDDPEAARRLAARLAEPGAAGVVMHSTEAVRRFYRERDHQPAWTRQQRPTPGAIDTLRALTRLPEHGLDPADYELEALRFDGGPYEIFDRHADLFGDGSVVVVPMPGHTPGSVAVFVNLPDGTRLLHVGDAVNDRSQIERLRGRASIMRRTDMDEPQANDNVARLHELQRRIPELRIIPAHERRAWAETFGRPGQGCAG